MKMRKSILLHILSLFVLIVPNLVYMLCNIPILKDTNYIAITMVALVVASIIGLGALIHFKIRIGVWILVAGVFTLVLSNIGFVAGIALIIEGIGLIIDGYLIRPLIVKMKVKELEANGKSITYTRKID